MSGMIKIREMQDNDAQAVLAVHYDAVHNIGKADYPAEILKAWSPTVDAKRIAGFLKNPDLEIRLVAEIDGKIVGFGMLVLPHELRACYVSSGMTKHGIGRRLLREIEKIAIENGSDFLQMDSSLTAEAFYRRMGYESLERGKHVMRNGMEMDAVKMRKKLKR